MEATLQEHGMKPLLSRREKTGLATLSQPMTSKLSIHKPAMAYIMMSAKLTSNTKPTGRPTQSADGGAAPMKCCLAVSVRVVVVMVLVVIVTVLVLEPVVVVVVEDGTAHDWAPVHVLKSFGDANIAAPVKLQPSNGFLLSP